MFSRAARPPYDVPAMPDDSQLTSAGAAAGSDFIDSLMETELYSIGAYFCDQSPELVDEVVARSEQIESRGLAAYAAEHESPVQEVFETLLTGLAVRYYKAVAG
jgi:hypothetical protein